MNKVWRDGIWGVIVGDVLGVPVEFSSRAERKADPVTDMRAYGHIINRQGHGQMTLYRKVYYANK